MTLRPSLLPQLRSRRRRLALAAGAALVLALVAVWVVAQGSGGDGRGTAAATASPSPSALASPPPPAPTPPTPEPTGPTSRADELPPTMAAVRMDQQAAVGNGITAEVVALEAVQGTGQGPGNIAGPALRVTVRIVNGTAGPVSLDGVAVDLAHGTELVPASPLDDPSAAPFSGTVEASQSAEGVYVFSVPADDRDLVSLSVGYQAGAPFLLFTGSGR